MAISMWSKVRLTIVFGNREERIALRFKIQFFRERLLSLLQWRLIVLRNGLVSVDKLFSSLMVNPSIVRLEMCLPNYFRYFLFIASPGGPITRVFHSARLDMIFQTFWELCASPTLITSSGEQYSRISMIISLGRENRLACFECTIFVSEM